MAYKKSWGYGKSKSNYKKKSRSASRSKKRSKFTAAQQQAYHSGRGYAVAHKGKGINFSKPEVRQSFREGYNAAMRTIMKNPGKYPDLKK